MIPIKPSGTVGFCSIAFLPAKVTTRLPKVAKAFSDASFTEDRLIKLSTTPVAIKLPEFSRTEDRFCNVVKHSSLVGILELDSRMETTEGIILAEVRENRLLARAEIDRRSCANSCLAVSSKNVTFSGIRDKIPASTIRALFLKEEHIKEQECYNWKEKKCLNI